MNTATTSRKALHTRVLAASLAGSAIEWFDYFLYGTVAALVFNKLFFPSFDPIVGLLLSYLSFSLTFIVSYATGTLTYSRVTVLNAITLAAVVTCIAVPFMGWLADRVGSRVVYLGGTVLMAVFAGPYFMLLDAGQKWSITLATVFSVGVIWAPIVATLGTIMARIFSIEIRFTGITLGSQIGAALAGGTAPLIATWLLRQSGGSWLSVAVYIAICAGISFVAVARQPDAVEPAMTA
ncbi:Major Facilitator Superfamily protein [Burkholderia sp. OK233]|nr:Major Facilitator Superfamily protein [Burkholderia sp. OK233]